MADTGKEGEWGSQAHSLFLSFLFVYTHTFCCGASFSLCWACTRRQRARETKKENNDGEAGKEKKKKKRHKEANGSREREGGERESQTLTSWSCLMRHRAWKKGERKESSQNTPVKIDGDRGEVSERETETKARRKLKRHGVKKGKLMRASRLKGRYLDGRATTFGWKCYFSKLGLPI